MKSVAIVEDNVDNQILVDALLRGKYQLTMYGSGSEALAGLKDNPPDLVLMDISLPEMDGPEVLKNMRDDPGLNGIPVVALTAHAMRGDRERFLGMGFNGYVSKPILDENLLFHEIERLLS